MIWELGELPFIWGYRTKPTNGSGVPDTLPFTIMFDAATGTVKQAYNKKVIHSLTKVYSKGAQTSGNMNEQGTGLYYAQSFIKFILRSFPRNGIKGVKVLEIGCGTGYLLYQLKQMGADVLGLEPGNHKIGVTKNYKIPIIHDFFPSKKIKGKFDAVILSSVLEHINDPIEFLGVVRKHMKPGGKLILSVPDGRPFFKNGDMSLPFHEHWNYFTEDSLYNNLALSGFNRIHIQKGSFGNVLYSWSMAGKGGGSRKIRSVAKLAQEFEAYKSRSSKNTILISRYINEAFKNGKTVGIYVAGRIQNILAYKKTEVGHLRFFDDDSLAHRKYFPGNAIPIESQDGLIRNPTDIVLIMSLAFGNRIKTRLRRILPDSCRIKTYREFLDEVKS